MKNSLLAVIPAILAVSLSGCGTICNFADGVIHPDDEPRIYGGVLRDLEIMDEAVNAPPRATPLVGSENGKGLIFLCLLGLMDPPLSFVGDTLTLPITIYVQEKRVAARNSDTDTAKPANATEPPTTNVSLGKPAPIAAPTSSPQP